MDILQKKQQETEGEGFHITSEPSALWYLRKLANLDAEQRRVKQQAQKLLASLQSEAESLKHLYQGELEEWTRQELAKKGNRKRTLHTLQGTLRFRNVPARLSLQSLSAALLQCEREGLPYIEIRQELNREEYLRYAQTRLQETGELLPGIDRNPEHESFSITFPNIEEN